ncbi:ankyrin repeat-containing domain protein [Camillea tinctor]|nr:ankyrin repeat-containing domain protein [Camillea tinctor]
MITYSQNTISQYKQQWFPGAESIITSVCIGYLLKRGLGFHTSDVGFENHLRDHYLYDYGAHNWGYHLKNSQATSACLNQFLREDTHVQCSFQAMMVIPNSTPKCDDAGMLLPKESTPQYSQQAPRNVSGLHLAAHMGNIDVVSLAINNGAIINCRDSNGQTPLWWAAKAGNRDIISLISKKDYITLRLRIEAQEENLAREFISCGYSPDTSDFKKRTPLHAAVIPRCSRVIDDLIYNGANIDAVDVNGMTPLQLALRKGTTDLVRILLKNRPHMGRCLYR